MAGAALSTRAAFAAVAALFFAWGFVCANNDPLIAAVRHVFRLSWTEALLTHIVFFFAFATVSLPAAALLARAGATRTILIALGSMLTGCLVIQAVRWVPAFGVFPVKIAALLGPQIALVHKALVNKAPSLAIWSICGVGANSLKIPP